MDVDVDVPLWPYCLSLREMMSSLWYRRIYEKLAFSSNINIYINKSSSVLYIEREREILQGTMLDVPGYHDIVEVLYRCRCRPLFAKTRT